MKAIINTNIVMPEYMIANASILIDGDKIIDFGKKVKIPTGTEIIDANGLFTGPGLIDIHTHAGGNEHFHEKPVYAAKSNLMAGVTSVMPTLYFSMTADMLIENAKRILDARDSGEAPNIIGLYMEAPYMNPKFGAHRESNPWRGDIKRESYISLLEEFGSEVKVWGIAPERENIEDFVKDALKFNPSTIFSVAHSEAEPHHIEPLKKYGLKLATHHTNATGTVHKHPECRGVCVDETVWYNDDIFAELICDRMGIHVDPYLQRLIRKIKGDDKIILISDGSVSDGDVPEGYEEATDIGFDPTGEIDGSKMVLPEACRNIMFHTGASLCQAFKFASTNPARLLKLDNIGEIAIGKAADLIMVDALFDVKHVIFKGNTIR